jgi:hypothetical protein
MKLKRNWLSTSFKGGMMTPPLEFNLAQAKGLLEMFGGCDTSITVDKHEGELIAYSTEYPEEGSTILTVLAQPPIAEIPDNLRITEEQAEVLHNILLEHSSDVTNYDLAADDMSAALFGGIGKWAGRAMLTQPPIAPMREAKMPTDDEIYGQGVRHGAIAAQPPIAPTREQKSWKGIAWKDSIRARDLAEEIARQFGHECEVSMCGEAADASNCETAWIEDKLTDFLEFVAQPPIAESASEPKEGK